MYTIYKVTNTLNNKVYIGQTKQTLAKRWYGHMLDARTRSETTHKYHFLRALNKYTKDVWKIEPIVENVPDYFVNAFEKYWINYYDSYNNGYNSTIGGEQPPIMVGTANPVYNSNTYTFYHKEYEEFTGTIAEFNDAYPTTTRNGALVIIANPSKSHRGWTTTREALSAIRGKANYTCSCGNPKVHSAKTCIKCRDTSGSNNGMYGKSRPDYVKKAVSERRRNEADQTKRTWIHDSGIIEIDITSLELRDKYNLNISHLKKITDGIPRYKTHKGWKLHVEENH